MSDLNTMYNNGMGSLASLTMGQDQAADRQKQHLAMQFEQQKMQQEAQMHPMKMQREQATLDQMAAQLPGIQGQSTSMMAKGIEDSTTLPQRMALKFSEMSTKMGAQGMERLGQEGERMLQIAGMLKGYPPAMHKQVVQKAMEQFGGDPNGPMGKLILSSPDEALQQTLQVTGEGMALASSKFVQDSAHKKAENDSQERIATAHDTARTEQERIKAEARANAERLRAAARQQGLSFEKQLTALSAIPETERTPEDWNRMTELKTMMYTNKTLGGNATTPEMLNMETPTTRAARLAQPTNRPAAPQADAGKGQDFKALAIQAWGSHDPDKYEYGINPDTGRPARRPK